MEEILTQKGANEVGDFDRRHFQMLDSPGSAQWGEGTLVINIDWCRMCFHMICTITASGYFCLIPVCPFSLKTMITPYRGGIVCVFTVMTSQR